MRTDELIRSLSHELAPVRPLRPPVTRALIWLAVTAVVAAIPVLTMADLDEFLLRSRDPRVGLEIAAALLTGIVAIVASFHLAVPDRSPRWMWAPFAPLALWVGASGLGCLRNGIGGHEPGRFLGLHWNCLVFVVGASVPLAIALFAVLRRARPIAPLRVAIAGGLGVAGLAAFLLEFFHPFEVTVLDLGVHVAAFAIVLALAASGGRSALARA